MPLPDRFAERAAAIVGSPFVSRDPARLESYGADALKQSHPPDLVILPATASEISELVKLCAENLVPLVVRGGGTGYTGGAVPIRGGVVLALERMVYPSAPNPR